MLQRLLIAHEQLKAGSKSENLLNEIRQILYSLSRAKEITKKAYKNILNSIKVLYKMDITFMISRNSKTSDTHRLLLNLLDKINLKNRDKYVALSNVRIYYTWENIKKSRKNKKFKLPTATWNEEFELTGRLFSV